jgi:hypothetical protein
MIIDKKKNEGIEAISDTIMKFMSELIHEQLYNY